jgi:hypothetical protein
VANIPTQKELQTPSPLLDAQGHLTQAGWSRQPLLDCNLENARFYSLRFLQRFRVKRWDYYGVTTPTHFFSATIGDIGYLASIFVYLIDLATGEYCEETLTIPLARGVALPRNSAEGESTFDNGKVRLTFRAESQARRVSVTWPSFGGRDLSAEVTMRLPPEHESMIIVIPIVGNRFYYNRKVNCMPAEGWIQWGDKNIEIQPANSLGNLDWGRGVWEYKSFWVWASASGFLPDGRTVGLNMGYGFGDTSAATENALILNGRIHKLAQVDFKYDSANFKRPWRMTAPDGRLDLEFVSFAERVAQTDFKVLSSEVHQMFGRYHGTVRTDDGEVIRLDGLVGFAEEHHAKW